MACGDPHGNEISLLQNLVDHNRQCHERGVETFPGIERIKAEDHSRVGIDHEQNQRHVGWLTFWNIVYRCDHECHFHLHAQRRAGDVIQRVMRQRGLQNVARLWKVRYPAFAIAALGIDEDKIFGKIGTQKTLPALQAMKHLYGALHKDREDGCLYRRGGPWHSCGPLGAKHRPLAAIVFSASLEYCQIGRKEVFPRLEGHLQMLAHEKTFHPEAGRFLAKLSPAEIGKSLAAIVISHSMVLAHAPHDACEIDRSIGLRLDRKNKLLIDFLPSLQGQNPLGSFKHPSPIHCPHHRKLPNPLLGCRAHSERSGHLISACLKPLPLCAFSAGKSELSKIPQVVVGR